MSDAARRRLHELLEQHGAALRAAITRACPPHLQRDLDDIEQEVRVRLWKALESEREIEHPASYLHVAAVNATLDAIRRRRARPEDAYELGEGEDAVQVVDRRPSPELLVSRRRTLRTVERCLDSIVPNRARAVRLHLQGFTTFEVGELLGWTEAKARNLVYRGLGDLRRALEEEGVDAP